MPCNVPKRRKRARREATSLGRLIFLTDWHSSSFQATEFDTGVWCIFLNKLSICWQVSKTDTAQASSVQRSARDQCSAQTRTGAFSRTCFLSTQLTGSSKTYICQHKLFICYRKLVSSTSYLNVSFWRKSCKIQVVDFFHYQGGGSFSQQTMHHQIEWNDLKRV